MLFFVLHFFALMVLMESSLQCALSSFLLPVVDVSRDVLWNLSAVQVLRKKNILQKTNLANGFSQKKQQHSPIVFLQKTNLANGFSQKN